MIRFAIRDHFPPGAIGAVQPEEDIPFVRDKLEPSAGRLNDRPLQVLLLGLAGAYANVVAYGFNYGGGNHQFELPLLNWLRNPRLYPHDPVREAFARFPTIFWPAVAHLSHWMSAEKVLFLFFLITKVLFFVALALLLRPRVQDIWLTAFVILAIALSPTLNDSTPLGGSDVLDSTQTHTSLAIALLLWVAWLLLEQRWVAAAVLCGITVYISAPFSAFMLFAFAVFAVIDWRRCKKSIMAAGVLGAAISAPWLALSRGVGYSHYPNAYVEALTAFYPFHFTLRGPEAFEVLTAAALVIAAALMILVARASGPRRDLRFEILAFSSLLPVVLGVLLSVVHLTPGIARLQLLRADSFLILYSILLVQMYGANLLEASTRKPATAFLVGSTAILLPLSNSLGLVWWGFIGMMLWADPQERFERLTRAAVRQPALRGAISAALTAGMVIAWSRHAEWSLVVVLVLVTLAGCVIVGTPRKAQPEGGARRIVCVLATASCIVVAASIVPGISRFWNPIVAPTPLESDWRAVQEWARANTEIDAQFLVPTYPCGFRAFSERSSWGEWKDGQAMYLYPPFAEVYRERMVAVGYSWQKWISTESITENYTHLSWDRAVALARQNHLRYIIQFRDVSYPGVPVFANGHYAVYKVES